MDERSNRELCGDFRALLTTGFHAEAGIDPDEALRITKPWRGEVWRAFRELEDRLCPVDADMRKKQDNGHERT